MTETCRIAVIHETASVSAAHLRLPRPTTGMSRVALRDTGGEA